MLPAQTLLLFCCLLLLQQPAQQPQLLTHHACPTVLPAELHAMAARFLVGGAAVFRAEATWLEPSTEQ